MHTRTASALTAFFFLLVCWQFPLRMAKGDLIEKGADGDGWINWNARAIKAVGRGAVPKNADTPAQGKVIARRLATVDAYRNLAETIAGVRVTGKTRVRNAMLENDEVQTSVEAFIKGAAIVEEKWEADGTYRVVLQAAMFGEENSLMQSLKPALFPVSSATPAPEESAPAPEPAPKEPEPAEPAPKEPAPESPKELAEPVGGMLRAKVNGWPKPTTGQFTSLLIDARGLGLQPSMSPKLLDESGKEVYGTISVDPDWVLEHGIVSYPRSMEEATKSARAGKRPLTVRALRTAPGKPDCLVISAADAGKVREADRHSEFFAACAVQFLKEPVRSGK